MTAADDFTRADPLYRRAMRHAANTGSAFHVVGSTGHRSSWWLVLVAVAVVGLGLWGLS